MRNSNDSISTFKHFQRRGRCSTEREGTSDKTSHEARFQFRHPAMSRASTACRSVHPQSYPTFRSRGTSRSRTSATATPTSFPTPPDEYFLQKKFSTLHRGDVKTLVVSSIAVASPIVSPSLNQATPLIEIAKEPSDMFLPFKAVVDALSVLIKNYDSNPTPVDYKAISTICVLACE